MIRVFLELLPPLLVSATLLWLAHTLIEVRAVVTILEDKLDAMMGLFASEEDEGVEEDEEAHR